MFSHTELAPFGPPSSRTFEDIRLTISPSLGAGAISAAKWGGSSYIATRYFCQFLESSGEHPDGGMTSSTALVANLA